MMERSLQVTYRKGQTFAEYLTSRRADYIDPIEPHRPTAIS